MGSGGAAPERDGDDAMSVGSPTLERQRRRRRWGPGAQPPRETEMTR